MRSWGSLSQKFGIAFGKIGILSLLGLLASLPAISARADEYYAQPDFSTPTDQSHLVMIDLKAYQQTTTYTCGPASVVTLMGFYGLTGDEMTLAREMKSKQVGGTNIINLANWLKQHGFEASWGQNGSLKLLRDNLTKGIPTLVGWMDWGGHYVLSVGYDDRGTEDAYDDIIVFADPADFYDGIRDGLTWFNAKRFDSMWMVQGDTAAQPWVKGLYVVAKPKKG
ncbi:MAG: C39 family peptidase [Candidatus Sericytochromatia bacterium]